MKMISWNVNGLRAIIKKENSFLDYFRDAAADIFCLQEIKLQEGQIELEFEGYASYWNYAEKKGYSGTAIFTKKKPLAVNYGIAEEEHDKEGRVITLEFEEYFVVTVYTPNSKQELLRLDYRLRWEDAFLTYIQKLNRLKPVIVCGDLNVAHKEIDLKNPRVNKNSPGFTQEERQKLNTFLQSGFIDTFRFFYPDLEGAYTWWSYMRGARKQNRGWRIDYFIVSQSLKDKLLDAKVRMDIFGSDHCPVEVELDLGRYN